MKSLSNSRAASVFLFVCYVQSCMLRALITMTVAACETHAKHVLIMWKMMANSPNCSRRWANGHLHNAIRHHQQHWSARRQTLCQCSKSFGWGTRSHSVLRQADDMFCEKATECTPWGIVRCLHWECPAVDWEFRRHWTGRFFSNLPLP